MKRKLSTGTLLMLTGLAVAGVYSYVNQPPAQHRRTFEADAHGRLVESERTESGVQPTPIQPLVKPEPAKLLSLASLELNGDQRARIQTISTQWLAAKASLEAAMEKSVAAVDRNATASVSSLKSDLGAYSQLSREFAARRDAAWQEALGVLTPAQRAQALEARQ